MTGRFVAATLALAVLALSLPAQAGGGHHGHWGGPGHWGGHQHHYYGHRHSRYPGAAFAGGVLFGALVGSLATPRSVYVAPPPPPPQPVYDNCRTIYGTGYANGRPAEYQGTGCYDARGNLYAMPGSERFLRYLD